MWDLESAKHLDLYSEGKKKRRTKKCDKRRNYFSVSSAQERGRTFRKEILVFVGTRTPAGAVLSRERKGTETLVTGWKKVQKKKTGKAERKIPRFCPVSIKEQSKRKSQKNGEGS